MGRQARTPVVTLRTRPPPTLSNRLQPPYRRLLTDPVTPRRLAPQHPSFSTAAITRSSKSYEYALVIQASLLTSQQVESELVPLVDPSDRKRL